MKMLLLEREVGEGRYHIWGSLSLSPGGAAIVLFGGEKPHVGSVALAEPRPSLIEGSDLISTTSSVINVVGHKDEVIAREAAEKAAIRFNCPVSATAGIHIQGASSQEIQLLLEKAHYLIDLLLEST